MKKLRIILLMALLNILLSPVGAISIKNETKPKAVIPATKQAPAGPNSPQNAGKEVKRQIQSSVSVIKPMKTNGKVLSVSASQTKPSNDSDGKKDVIKVAPLKIIAQPIAELKPSTVPPKTPSTPNPKPPVTAIVKQKEAPKSQVVGEKKPQEKSPPVKSKLEEVSKELETLKKEVKDLQAGVIKGKKTQKAVEKSKKIIFKIVPSGAKRNEQTKKNDMKKNDKKVEQKKGGTCLF
jgi:hypothetical protein